MAGHGPSAGRWRIILPTVVGGLCVACAPQRVGRPLVLLASWDTTRTDALGCYGGTNTRTPTADRLAETGVRFAWAMSSSSTTLAAHTTVMTGLDAHDHAVPRNGFPIPPHHEVLADRFAQEGWDTLAVVGSYALEAKMGLDRGFREYHDDGGWQAAVLNTYEVNAKTVTDIALKAALAAPTDQPLFLFVHYYDAHMPWSSAPPALQAEFTDPSYDGQAGGNRDGIGYLTEATRNGTLRTADRDHATALYHAEVAWVDQQFGRLLEGLEAAGMLTNSLIVLFSDHGEIFDEEPERPFRHGPDVDLPIVHVPLVIAGRGAFAIPAGVVVNQTVRTEDVGTTLLSQIAPRSPGLGTGLDLSLLWGAAPPLDWPTALAEATKPIDHIRADAWPNADFERAAISQTHIVTHAPYLATPPRTFLRQTGQPIGENDDHQLIRELSIFDARMPGRRVAHLDADTRAALGALGYLTDEP